MNHNAIFDSAETRALMQAATAPTPTSQSRLDAVKTIVDSAATFAMQGLSVQAAATVQTWAGETDMDDGEGPADRLIAMLVGIADDNKDGELSEEEQEVVNAAATEAWNYLSAKGAADSDLDLMFNSEDPAEANAAAARVQELIADGLPEGDEADDEIDDFAFGQEGTEGVFDAVYKKRFAIRKGKKTVVRKRIAGTVRLSAKQRLSIRKAGMKSGSARAKFNRMKSMRVRKSRGM